MCEYTGECDHSYGGGNSCEAAGFFSFIFEFFGACESGDKDFNDKDGQEWDEDGDDKGDYEDWGDKEGWDEDDKEWDDDK